MSKKAQNLIFWASKLVKMYFYESKSGHFAHCAIVQWDWNCFLNLHQVLCTWLIHIFYSQIIFIWLELKKVLTLERFKDASTTVFPNGSWKTLLICDFKGKHRVMQLTELGCFFRPPGEARPRPSMPRPHHIISNLRAHWLGNEARNESTAC